MFLVSSEQAAPNRENGTGMSNESAIFERATDYDGGVPSSFEEIVNYAHRIEGVHRFIVDAVDAYAVARRSEAEGETWTVPCELREPGADGADPYVTQDGTPSPRPRSSGQGAWNRDRRDGVLRPAFYVWVTEGVNLDMCNDLAHRASVLHRLASFIVRRSRATKTIRDQAPVCVLATHELSTVPMRPLIVSSDSEPALITVLREMKELYAELRTQDPSLRTVLAQSEPAYLNDRDTARVQYRDGYHWGERPHVLAAARS